MEAQSEGKYYLDPESLRFRVGDKVQCRIGPDSVMDWGNGTVMQLCYRENNWPPGQVAPYKIALEDGRNIFAPEDIPCVIRKPPAFESQSEVQSSHNSSETTNGAVYSWDDLTEGQRCCLAWAAHQDWDLIKGCAKEHGPEVLLGVHKKNDDEGWKMYSVLTAASLNDNIEMAKLTLEAGFDNKEVMYWAAQTSMNHSDNSTILRLLLEHGLDPNIDPRFEGLTEVFYNNLLMRAAEGGHIDHAMALLDHGANVNKTESGPGGHVGSPLICTVNCGAHDFCRLFLTRGAIPTTNDVENVFRLCHQACKGEHTILSRDVAIKMFATFLHLGKPDSDVVRDKFDSFVLRFSSYRDPTIANITKQYLQGRPFCCEVCEALTAKSRDKLLMCPCRNVAYCSKECQLKHWKKHKVQCTGPLNERGESEAMVKKRSKTGKGTKTGGSSHNSSETTNVTVHSWDDLTDGQRFCIMGALDQDWDRVKGYAKEHGPEVLLGVYTNMATANWNIASVLSLASHHDNVEIVKLSIDAGFDNKEAMYWAADISMKNSDNSTILRLLLEHGLDPNMDLGVEGVMEGYSNLLVDAVQMGHIDQAIALLDHGANVNKIVVDPNGVVGSPLSYTVNCGAHDICRLFLTRGAIPTTSDVDHVLGVCLHACKGLHSRLSRDVAIKMFATFLHLGKPDSDVVRDKISLPHRSRCDPTIANITKHYLQGRPFCCEVCEALTAKEHGRDKLLMCPCRNVAYCSKECQLKHWREHKMQCTGPLNEKGESEAMVKGRRKTGKEAAAGGADVGVAEGAVADVGVADVGVAEGAVETGKNGKKGKKGKKGKNGGGKKK
ncbi:hypothetical protein TrCOL_g9598 [Triparma columacea]|uniref:MYND-type domain-containing protein n=1 Tax=Triparma columacea TaxID=722753 RepID=A0A9W7FYU3_9STRA|nr:hypothetical protein TrCOL_g9598 [Triparma columacea]